MRTVIFLGLLSIADAINENWHEDSLIPYYFIVLICAIGMDIWEFWNKLKNNKKTSKKDI